MNRRSFFKKVAAAIGGLVAVGGLPVKAEEKREEPKIKERQDPLVGKNGDPLPYNNRAAFFVSGWYPVSVVSGQSVYTTLDIGKEDV